MSVQVENLEKNMAKLTVEVPAEEVEKAIQAAYLKDKSKFNIPGFRKGKVPRKMIEKMYGAGVFYEEAVNSMLPAEYSKAVEESGLEVVSQPQNIDIVQIEKGKTFIFTAEVAVKPDVELGQYKGLEVLKTDTTVTDEDVERSLKAEQEKNSRTLTVEDRAAENGDIVTIDYVGTIDDVPFDGGSAEGYPLTLGSGAFIPGFEEQLVGAQVDDVLDVVTTFPENYHAEELKGKTAVFKTTVHKIEKKELPELDDDFAMDVSEFDTLEEYKADIRKNLEEKKAEQAKIAKQNAAVAKAAENATIDVPDAMVTSHVEDMLMNYGRNLQAQGFSLEQYVQMTGQTMDALREEMKPDALNQIRTRLVLEKVAETENIEITEETLDEEYAKMAKQYGMEVEQIKNIMSGDGAETIKKDLAVQKAADLIGESAVEVESVEEEPAETPAE